MTDPCVVRRESFSHGGYIIGLYRSGAVILNSLLNTLPPDHVRSKADDYIQMISECNEQYFPKVVQQHTTIFISTRISLILEHPLSFAWSFTFAVTTCLNTLGSPIVEWRLESSDQIQGTRSTVELKAMASCNPFLSLSRLTWHVRMSGWN